MRLSREAVPCGLEAARITAPCARAAPGLRRPGRCRSPRQLGEYPDAQSQDDAGAHGHERRSHEQGRRNDVGDAHGHAQKGSGHHHVQQQGQPTHVGWSHVGCGRLIRALARQERVKHGLLFFQETWRAIRHRLLERERVQGRLCIRSTFLHRPPRSSHLQGLIGSLAHEAAIGLRSRDDRGSVNHSPGIGSHPQTIWIYGVEADAHPSITSHPHAIKPSCQAPSRAEVHRARSSSASEPRRCVPRDKRPRVNVKKFTIPLWRSPQCAARNRPLLLASTLQNNDFCVSHRGRHAAPNETNLTHLWAKLKQEYRCARTQRLARNS